MNSRQRDSEITGDGARQGEHGIEASRSRKKEVKHGRMFAKTTGRNRGTEPRRGPEEGKSHESSQLQKKIRKKARLRNMNLLVRGKQQQFGKGGTGGGRIGSKREIKRDQVETLGEEVSAHTNKEYSKA